MRTRSGRNAALIAAALVVASTAGIALAEPPRPDDAAPVPIEAAPDGLEPIDVTTAVAVARQFVADQLPDVRLDAASAVDGTAAVGADTSARDAVSRHARPASSEPTSDFVVSSVVASRHNASTTVYLQRNVAGVDVRGAIVNVAVAADGSVLTAAESEAVLSRRPAPIGTAPPAIDVVEAAAAAAASLGLEPTSAFDVLSGPAGPEAAPS